MMLENVIVLGSKGHCQLEEERIIYEEIEVEGDDYPECIEDDVEELDSDFERDLGIVSGCEGNLTSVKKPAINNNGGKRKCKLLKVKVCIHKLNFDMHLV